MSKSTKAGQLELWNAVKADTIRAAGEPQYWIVVTPTECEGLVAGQVSASIQGQCRTLLRVELEEHDQVWEASQASVEAEG
jgi:hypothetical protein